MNFRFPFWNRERGLSVIGRLAAGAGELRVLEWRERVVAPGREIVALLRGADGFWLAGEGELEGTTVMFSPDGERWLPGQQFAQVLGARCLVRGRAGLVLGCAGGTILSSEEGTSWKKRRAIISDGINCGVWGEGVWVLGADRGGLLRSDDEGASWAYFYAGLSVDLRSLAYGAGCFVATASGGMVLRSENGVDWRPCRLHAQLAGGRVWFENGRFVLAGQRGALWSSGDGGEWTRHDVGTSEALLGVAYDDGVWTVVGGHGWVFRSVDLVVWQGGRVPGLEWRGPLVCVRGVYLGAAARGQIVKGGAGC
jgi:hypothetical protein